LNGKTGTIVAGGNGTSGDVRLESQDDTGKDQNRIRLISSNASVWVGGHDADGDLMIFAKTGDNETHDKATIHLDGSTGAARFGGNGVSGDITLESQDDKGKDQNRIRLTSSNACVWVGGHDADGDLMIFAKTGDNETQDQATIHLDGASGAARFGGNGLSGDIKLQSKDDSGKNQNRIRLTSSNACVWVGGHDQDGDVVLFASKGDNETLDKATIHLNGAAGALQLGGNGTNGNITLRTTDAKDSIRLESEFANVWVGGNGLSGDVMVFSQNGDNKTSGNASIRLNGEDGDIILRNADCAEEFDSIAGAEPGTVMVIDSDEALRPSARAYDRRVAGVISGAGVWRPGIVLDRREDAGDRLPIALVGKVYCKVDATYGPIELGALLTTSETPGHAMRAADPTRAPGAVIGKALRAFAAGTGLIPILVSLQ
jgi:hypothetical protein